MDKTCPNCGALVSEAGDAFCLECGVELSRQEGEWEPARKPLLALPPPGQASNFPFWIVPLVTGVLGAFGLHSGESALSFVNPSIGAIVGGVLGFLLGMAVAWDARSVQFQVEEWDWAGLNTTLPEEVNLIRPPKEGIAAVMLAIPFLFGLVLWQRELFGLNRVEVGALFFGAIFLMALLGYVDARQLLFSRLASPAARRPATVFPLYVLVGILGLWMIAFPLYFFGRTRYGARNLVLPALAATFVLLAPTSLARWLTPAELPPITDPRVLSLVKQLVESHPEFQRMKEDLGQVVLRDAAEIAYDPKVPRRRGRAILVTLLQEETIFFTLEWEDRRRGIIRVSWGEGPGR